MPTLTAIDVAQTIDRSNLSPKSIALLEYNRERQEEAEKSLLPNVILADPPWKYENDRGVWGGNAGSHYDDLSLPEIRSFLFDNSILTALNAVLFLWTTISYLPEGFEVMRSWGFTYKANIVWVKMKAQKLQTFDASYLAYAHEHCLIGVKGVAHPPNKRHPASLWPSVIIAPRREHSRKPEELHDIIELLYPKWKYLELFATTKRDNWMQIGNQLGESHACK